MAYVACATFEKVAVSSFPRFNQAMEQGETKDFLVRQIEAVAIERDRAAFKLLFDHFAPRINAYLLRQGVAREQAEDLVQDVMLLVWRRAHQFDKQKAALSTWIYAIARNRWIDVLRRDKRPEIDFEDPSLEGSEPPRGDDHMEAVQLQDRVRLAIETLPVEQAEILRVFYFEDKSHTVIAEELGLPLGTVKSRLRLALSKLKSQFENVF